MSSCCRLGIGRAIYSRVFPDSENDSVEQDGDSYLVSNEYHSAGSTIKFQINGDTVTYWTQAAGDTTADGDNEEHTVSISDLLGKKRKFRRLMHKNAIQCRLWGEN